MAGQSTASESSIWLNWNHQAEWIEETGRMEEERRRLAARREELREQKKVMMMKMVMMMMVGDHDDNWFFSDVGEVPEDGRGPAEAKQIPGISSRRKKIEGFRQCAQFKSPTVTNAQDLIVVYFSWCCI